jgi:hypothetical protein
MHGSPDMKTHIGSTEEENTIGLRSHYQHDDKKSIIMMMFCYEVKLVR